MGKLLYYNELDERDILVYPKLLRAATLNCYEQGKLLRAGVAKVLRVSRTRTVTARSVAYWPSTPRPGHPIHTSNAQPHKHSTNCAG